MISSFVVSWKIANSGQQQWPFGSLLICTDGDDLPFGLPSTVMALDPGQMCDVSVNMRSPEEPGICNSTWMIEHTP